MQTYRYLIVGGGMTADSACRGIRREDPDGSIGLVSAEHHPPYARPPLSKKLWAGGAEESIWRGTSDRGVDLQLGHTITSLDLDARRATDNAGVEYTYERLLLATGGSPRRLPFGDQDGVVYFRTLDDYRRLRELAASGADVVVVGGGFIGSEIAAALATNGCTVTMIFPEAGVGARVFPAELSAFVTDYYREKGVEVLAGASLTGIETEPLRALTEDGRVLEASAIVAGLGIQPVTDLATAAGLTVDDGIVVDELGRAGGREDVFAAGDVARFPIPALGGLTRVEHEDHANTHGECVGANMAGASKPYDHLPFFYSDLFELGYEAVGEIDARSDTVVHWTEPNRSGVVCYVDADRRPRGFLLWNVWDQVDAARDLIRAGEPLDKGALAKLAG